MKQKAFFSKNKADAISNALFFILLGMMIYSASFWPFILIAFWVWLGSRQFLTGRVYDLAISTLLFIGLFFVDYFELKWSILMPVIFVVGGLYLILREYYFGAYPNGEDISDEIQDDLDV
jgi:hypothetical protein